MDVAIDAMVLGTTIGTTVVSVRVNMLGCVTSTVIIDDPDTVVEQVTTIINLDTRTNHVFDICLPGKAVVRKVVVRVTGRVTDAV
jgi:hypothetical protein